MVHCACFVYCCSITKLCPTVCDPMTAACQAPLSSSISLSLLKLMSTEPILLSNHLNIFYPLLFLPSIFPSVNIFSNELALCLGAKVLELQRQSFQWIFRVDFFRIDWFDLLAVQGTLQESFPAPQFKSINSLALSLLYGPTLTFLQDYWKTTALTRWAFVRKLTGHLDNL